MSLSKLLKWLRDQFHDKASIPTSLIEVKTEYTAPDPELCREEAEERQAAYGEIIAEFIRDLAESEGDLQKVVSAGARTLAEADKKITEFATRHAGIAGSDKKRLGVFMAIEEFFRMFDDAVKSSAELQALNVDWIKYRQDLENALVRYNLSHIMETPVPQALLRIRHPEPQNF